MNRKVFTVHQINQYIKSVLEDDFVLNSLFVEGEISNLKHHASGHMYFTLKDGMAAINCVMFKSSAHSLLFLPENGMKVIVFGRISLYEKTGQYQLYAEMMEPSGRGALFIAFEQLRNRLEAEGLFDPSHKKVVPPFPKCIAIVTSPSGAAVRDILQIAKRRNKHTELVVVPTAVQGDAAPSQIAGAIKDVCRWGKADVMIVGRGGGSMEDLWAFNDERVARAIYESTIPVISAVGHETDFTIADFVADMRAPTPSAAAELAVTDENALATAVRRAEHRLQNAIVNTIAAQKNRFEYLLRRRAMKRMHELVYDGQIYVDELYRALNKAVAARLEDNGRRLASGLTNLEAVSPLRVMQRGYAVVTDCDGGCVRSVKELAAGWHIHLQFADGVAQAVVESTGDGNG